MDNWEKYTIIGVIALVIIGLALNSSTNNDNNTNNTSYEPYSLASNNIPTNPTSQNTNQSYQNISTQNETYLSGRNPQEPGKSGGAVSDPFPKNNTPPKYTQV